MRFFHTLGVYMYGLLLFIAQPFNKKAKKWIQGRENYWSKLPTVSTNNVVWFHCASLGEFDQGIPVMQKIKENDNAVFLVVTFFSPSGMENYHKRNHPADWVGYLPLPTPTNAKRFVQYFKPQKVFFVKYEFWDNFLIETKKAGAKNYCVAANFRANHRFFGSFKHLFAPTLFLFDKIFVQNDTSLQLLESIHYSKGVVSGDTRIDKVLENKEKRIQDELVEQFLDGQKAIVLGSSWPVDENLWVNYVQQHTTQKFIIAPHDISEKHIANICHLFPTAKRYTKNTTQHSNILIVDCIGKLSNMYQYAQLAYIGGGFTGKLHNILEAAVFNIPIVIGPKHSRFPEAQQLINLGVVASVKDKESLENQIACLQENQTVIKEKSAHFFETNKNASQRIYDQI